MKKMMLLLVCAAIVVGLQLPKEKTALANNLEIQKQFSDIKSLSEDTEKEAPAEKNVDSTTESTKKKKYK